MYCAYKSLLYLSLIIIVALPTLALTDAEIESLIATMSVEEKVGQLLIFGVGGPQVGPIAKGLHYENTFCWWGLFSLIGI